MDYIVISDTHLGHDIYCYYRQELAHRIDIINENLARFLRRATERAVKKGRPFTLVILGDFIDFCKASFLYSEQDQQELDWDPAASVKGLPVTAKNMAWKLRKIAALHRPIFRSLGALVSLGNRIVIVSGNHDSMFYWPAVQQAFREEVLASTEIAPGDREDQQQIEFRHWFYFEPGLFYMEHGHRFDRLSTSQYPLLPTDLYDPKRLFLPMNLASMQYYAQNFTGGSPEHAASVSATEALRVLLESQKMDRRSRFAFLITLRLYLSLLASFTVRWLKNEIVSHDLRIWQNELALREVASGARLDHQTVHQLYALNETPLEGNILRVWRVFFFDIFMLLFLSIAGLVWLTPLTWQMDPTLAGRVSFLMLIPLLFTLLLLRVQGRKRMVAEGGELRRKVASIARLVRVPAVVLGHTHVLSWSKRDNELAVINAAKPTEQAPADPAEGETSHTHLVFNSGTWNIEEGLASYLLFEQIGAKYHVKTMLWNLRTHQEYLVDTHPLQPGNRKGERGGKAGVVWPLGPSLAVATEGKEYKLHGTIDVGARIDRLLSREERLIILDLSGIERITSAGLAEWIHAIQRKQPGLQVILTACPRRLVSMFRGTTDALHAEVNVVSFDQLFRCKKCGRLEDHLIWVPERKGDPRQVKIPTYPCSCGATMTIVGVPKARCYSFLEEVRGRFRLQPQSGVAWIEAGQAQICADILTLSSGGLSIHLALDGLQEKKERPIAHRESEPELLSLLAQQELSLQLSLPKISGPIAARTSVRWKRVHLDDTVELGLMFIKINPLGQRLLEQFLQRQMAELRSINESTLPFRRTEREIMVEDHQP